MVTLVLLPGMDGTSIPCKGAPFLLLGKSFSGPRASSIASLGRQSTKPLRAALASAVAQVSSAAVTAIVRMHQPEMTTHAGIQKSTSIMSFEKAFDLFIRPRKFFSSPEIYDTRFAHLLAAWIVGMNATADQIDKKLIASQVAGKVNSAVQFAMESWGHYWGLLAGFGLLGAFFCWFIGGWWYGKRLQFSGASNVDPLRARKANVYQSLVHDIPALCLTAYYTASFPNYLATWQSDELWSLLVIVPAVFFSCWVSFVAATTSFVVSRWKAMIWFLVLPISFYMVALGGLSYLLRMAQ